MSAQDSSSQGRRPPQGSDELLACEIVAEEDDLPLDELTAIATPHGYTVFHKGVPVDGEVSDQMISQRRAGNHSV